MLTAALLRNTDETVYALATFNCCKHCLPNTDINATGKCLVLHDSDTYACVRSSSSQADKLNVQYAGTFSQQPLSTGQFGKRRVGEEKHLFKAAPTGRMSQQGQGFNNPTQPGRGRSNSLSSYGPSSTQPGGRGTGGVGRGRADFSSGRG